MSTLFYWDADIPHDATIKVHDTRSAGLAEAYSTGEIVSIWGNVFRWDSYCVPQSKMELWRQRGDGLADAALPIIMGPAGASGGSDLFARLEAAARADDPAPEVKALWYQLHSGPLLMDADWPDAEQVRRGQAAFYRYAPQFLAALLHSSLAGGFSSPRISRVLNIASYLVPPMTSTPEGEAPLVSKSSSDRTFRRLMETVQFVINSMPAGAMEPDSGNGWKTAIRVRLLHATMRKRIVDMIKRDEESGTVGVYDPATEGVPLSMEDMAATLSSFGPTQLVCAPRQGVIPTPQECEDYIALWRVLGYYLGIDIDILKEHFPHHHASTRLLASSLINLLAGETDPPPPCQFPFSTLAPEIAPSRLVVHPKHAADPYKAPATLAVLFSVCHRWPCPFTFSQQCAAARWMVGPTMADWLSIPRSTWTDRLSLRIGFASVNAPARFAGWWREGWGTRYRDAMQRSVEDAAAMELGNRHTKYRPRAPDQFEPTIDADEWDRATHGADAARAALEWVLLYAEMAAVMASPVVVAAGSAWWVWRRGGGGLARLGW